MPSDPPRSTTPDPQESERPGAATGPGDRSSRATPAAPADDMLMPFGAPTVDEAPGEGDGSSDAPPPANGKGGAGQGGGRGRRRRARSALRPLWWSMPIVVIMALASVFLTGLHVWSAASVKAYQSEGFDRARSGFEGQLGWTRSGPEAWVADYNLGSTLLVQGYLDVGVAHLERAMDTVPRATEIAPGFIESFSYECRVRTNLALGIEGQGDVLAASLQWADAADLYEHSAELLAPCGNVDNSQPQSGGGQSGDPQSGGGGGQSGEPQSGGEGGDQGGEPQSGEPQSGGQGGDQGGEPQSGEPQSGDEGGDQGDSSAQPSPGPSGQTGSAEPSSAPSGQTGTGQQGDPGQEADSAKDRLDGKARDARERAEGNAPSPQPSQGQSPQPSPGPSGEPTQGPSPQPTPGNEPSGAPGSGPSASPTPDPFGNETEDQRARREELERQLEQARNDQGDIYDQNRPGNPNGGW